VRYRRRGEDIVFKTGWKDRDIIVDGRNDDWQGALGYLGDPVVALGFLNDASGIYVCIATNVPALSEGLLQRGMTVWIDPKGGKKKTLGIRLAPATPPRGPGDKPKGASRRRENRPSSRRRRNVPGALRLSFRLMVRLLARMIGSPSTGRGRGRGRDRGSGGLPSSNDAPRPKAPRPVASARNPGRRRRLRDAETGRLWLGPAAAANAPTGWAVRLVRRPRERRGNAGQPGAGDMDPFKEAEGLKTGSR
jgi:hypothetical protein